MSGDVEWDDVCPLCDVTLPGESGVSDGRGFMTQEAVALGIADLLDDATLDLPAPAGRR